MTPMTAPRVKLDIDATREKLAALGLGHAVDALEGLLTDAVRAEMARSDVFVAPASLESFGIAALEAHAAGLPVVGRLGTGLSDFIEDGRSGNLVDGDRSMTDVLVRMAIHDEHKTLSTSPALAEFRWPVILQRHRDLYEVAGASTGSRLARPA